MTQSTESAAILTWQERVAGMELNGMTNYNAMSAEIADLRAALAAVPGQSEPVALLREALMKISNTRFGWDGDCGVTTIADDALYATENIIAAPVVLVDDEAVKLLKRLKRDLMGAWRFQSDTLDTYRRACSSAEGDIEEFLNELRDKSAASASVPNLRKLTNELDLKEIAAEFAACSEAGWDCTISPGVCAKLFEAMTTPPASVPQPAVPQGYVLVPIRATNAMVEAAYLLDTKTCVWEAMVNAAPVAPAVQDAPSDEQTLFLAYWKACYQYSDAHKFVDDNGMWCTSSDDPVHMGWSTWKAARVAAPVSGEVVRPDLEMRELLQQFLDYHSKPAGMTRGVLEDDFSREAFWARIQEREKEMVAKAIALLAPDQTTGEKQ